MATNLRAFGVVAVEETEDGMRITGGNRLRGGTVSSFGDHRIAMSAAVAALSAEGAITVDDVRCVATSFPNFFELLNQVAVR
jgi:3-phosphoshikimate 1-carboxyvinyltransferase